MPVSKKFSIDDFQLFIKIFIRKAFVINDKEIRNSTRIIYTPSTFARTSLLHLQEVGTLHAIHPHISKRSDLYNLADSSDHIRDMRINEKLATLLTLLMEQSWNPENVTVSRKRMELVEIKSYLRAFCKIEGISPSEYRKQW